MSEPAPNLSQANVVEAKARELKQCPVCGFRYVEGRHSLCSSCPLNHGCQITCCPNCGYEAPPEGRLVRWLKSWTKKRAAQLDV